MALLTSRQAVAGGLLFIGLGVSPQGFATTPFLLTDPHVSASKAEQSSTKSARSRSKRAAPVKHAARWPNNTVVYSLEGISSKLEGVVLAAIDHIQQHTAIRFIERTDQSDYVAILEKEESGSTSSVGFQGGRQSIRLAKEAGIRTALHEFGHTLGFNHEHQRSDRDTYVTVNSRDNEIFLTYDDLDQTTPYDYESVMHYGSGEGGKVIKTKDKSKQSIIGTIAALSAGDIATLARMYPNPSGVTFSPDKVVVEPQGNAVFTLANTAGLSIDDIQQVSANPKLTWSRTQLSDGSMQIHMQPKLEYQGKEILGDLELQLWVPHASGSYQKIILPVQVEKDGGGNPNPNPNPRERQLISLANNDHLRSRNERYGQCLEALDDGYSWFWLKGERTVGMRECDSNNTAQKWIIQEGVMTNVRYPKLCLGKSQWTSTGMLGDQERGYAALKTCDGKNDQQWQFEEIGQLDARVQNSRLARETPGKVFIIFNASQDNKVNALWDKLSLMQGNGTVVVEEAASRSLDRALGSAADDGFIRHYLWQWK